MTVAGSPVQLACIPPAGLFLSSLPYAFSGSPRGRKRGCMSDPSEGSGESAQTQLSRSLGTIWERHSGGRPKSVSAEIAGNVVKCEVDTEGETPKTVGYRNEAMA